MYVCMYRSGVSAYICVCECSVVCVVCVVCVRVNVCVRVCVCLFVLGVCEVNFFYIRAICSKV